MGPHLDVGTTMTVLLTTTLRLLVLRQAELHLEGGHPPWGMAQTTIGEVQRPTIVMHLQVRGPTRHVTQAALLPLPLGVTM